LAVDTSGFGSFGKRDWWIFPKLMIGRVIVLTLCLFCVCFAQTGRIHTKFEHVNPVIQSRILEHVKKLVSPTQNVFLSFGPTDVTKRLITQSEMDSLPSEAYIVRSDRNMLIDNLRYDHVFVCVGQVLKDYYPNYPKREFPIGTSYAAYHLLEHVGFGFFHPFHVIVPDLEAFTRSLVPINITSTPKFEARGTHLHTMHPIELNDYLQGFGSNNMSTLESDWATMHSKYDDFLEWLVANRQNRMEWYLLWAYNWRQYGESQERLGRLTRMVKRSQDFGVVTGLVTPFVFMQQHSFTLIREAGTLQFEFAQLHKRMRWVLETGSDFITIEMGFSEFTSGNATRMLLYFNEAVKFLYDNYSQKGIYTKVHISSNQLIDEFKDPLTGKPPMNYNFLPHYVDKRLGIFPHTVQLYALDDLAPTYGNANFSHMFKFMMFEADKRETLFYPETNYWVNYDSNVPLFLPLYADRRLHDLRLIAKEEVAQRKKVKGQINFSSGWEFAYWINDFITARAAWDPMMDMTHDNALLFMLNQFTRTFGRAQNEVTRILFLLIKDQRDLLIDGKINGQRPTKIVDRNGIAYLQGVDVWADVPHLLGIPIDTHPSRLSFEKMYRGEDKDPNYVNEIRPLLNEMNVKFTAHATKFKDLLPLIPAYSLKLYQDIVDTAEILGLRAKFVFELSEYAWGFATRRGAAFLEEKKRIADKILVDAGNIMNVRKEAFFVSPKIIASWRENPTAYPFTYLWSATTLHFWKRDYRKVIKQNSSPCLLNIINPVDIALGQGILQNGAKSLRNWFQGTPFTYATDCFAAPDTDPHP
jgi:hypothetical protein